MAFGEGLDFASLKLSFLRKVPKSEKIARKFDGTFYVETEFPYAICGQDFKFLVWEKTKTFRKTL